MKAEKNYEFCPDHKELDTFKVHNWEDPKSVCESCNIVQDDSSDHKSVLKPFGSSKVLASSKNVDMASGETCHKDNNCHVIQTKKLKSEPENLHFKERDKTEYPVVHPQHSKIVRVCTRARNYDSGDSREKVNSENENSFENMRDNQEADAVISKIIKWKTENVKPTWADVSHMSPELKFYWSRLDSLILKEGILYRKWESDSGKHYELHIVIPSEYKKLVLNQVHNTVTGGHLGVRKTLSKVKKRYFWYKMRQDVKYWCAKCDICASKKAPCRKPRAPMQQYIVGAPWERMAIDILGPLPKTYKGNRYLMVVEDYFTKWTEAIPIKDMEAITVAQKFAERIVTIFGVPLQIHSDHGTILNLMFLERCVKF